MSLDFASKLLHTNPTEFIHHGNETGRCIVWGHEAAFKVVELVYTVLRSEGREIGGSVLYFNGDRVPALGTMAVHGTC